MTVNRGKAPTLASLTRSAAKELAWQDWRLRERLAAHAATRAGKRIDVAKWRRRVDAAFGSGAFVPYAPDCFDDLIASIRAEHKLKRNLMALFDQKGW